MIANWMEKALILSPETDKDEQALKAIAAACPGMVWVAEPALGGEVKTTAQAPRWTPTPSLDSTKTTLLGAASERTETQLATR